MSPSSKTKCCVYVLQTPHLVNLNEDPLMSECLLYYIKEGVTRSAVISSLFSSSVNRSLCWSLLRKSDKLSLKLEIVLVVL